MKAILYSSAVGSLLYAQICTRPDLAFTIRMFGRYLSNPGLDHPKAVKRVMRYLHMKDYMLTFRRIDHLEFVGYSDSNFARCIDIKQSISGYIFMVVRGVISCKSVKQSLITSLTMKAEIVACFEASNHTIWL